MESPLKRNYELILDREAHVGSNRGQGIMKEE